MFEIVVGVQVGNQPGLYRPPSQSRLCLRARSRTVDTKEVSDPAKMIGCFLARFADNRYVQATADCLSDLSSRYALVGDAVIRGTSNTFLKHKPVKVSRIEPMHRWPAIKPVPYECRNSFFTRDADQTRHKAVVAIAVDRRRKPQHRCADSARRQRKRRLLRFAGEVGVGCIFFRCERALAFSEQGPRGDDQRAL